MSRWAFLIALGLLGCREEDPVGGTLVLEFDHRMGDERLQLGTPYLTRYGQEVTFDHLRYWVSNVGVANGEGEPVWAPGAYFLVEQTAQRTRLQVEVPGVPAGRYDRLMFHLGVDPGPNASLDLMDGELAPDIGMDWGWDTGYKFLRTEGTFEEAGVTGAFAIHTGNDVLYKRLTAELPEPVRVEEEGRVAFTLRAEVDRLFAGVQLSRGPEILGGTVESLAGKVAGNHGRLYRLVTPEGELPLSASSPNLEVRDSGDIPTDGTPPVLSEAVVSPADLYCAPVPDRPSNQERGCFTPFHLGSGSAWLDAGFFTWVVDNGAPVTAASGGVIDAIVMMDHSHLTHADLFEVRVRANDDAAFTVVYRNLKDLQVARGERVEAGVVLGGAGDYHHPDVGLVGLAVERRQEVTQRMCPTRYAEPGFVAAADEAQAQSAAAWPDHALQGLCAAQSVVCGEGACEAPSAFVVADGDVDEGRRIYASTCASCHGREGEGGVAGPLCASSADCGCVTCTDHATLAARIQQDMPPEGYCGPDCAAEVAAFILHGLGVE